MQQLIERLVTILKENCVGIYLHGSSAMGCYQAKRSDIDFLVVVDSPLDLSIRKQILDALQFEQSKASGNGYEMSIVLKQHTLCFSYPTPYEFHFSKAHEQEALEDPIGYLHRMQGEDYDLAAHFMVIRKRGVVLYGKPILEIFGEIPRKYYLHSLFLDLKDYHAGMASEAVYHILNACRIVAFLKEELVLSKKEGGEYYLNKGNPSYYDVINQVLTAYRDGQELLISKASYQAFLEEVLMLLKNELELQ